MNQKINRNRFILPATNTVASTNANPQIKNFLARLESNIKSSDKSSVKLNPRNAPGKESSPINIKVIDSIHFFTFTSETAQFLISHYSKK